jgi:hypothetical protein
MRTTAFLILFASVLARSSSGIAGAGFVRDFFDVDCCLNREQGRG